MSNIKSNSQRFRPHGQGLVEYALLLVLVGVVVVVILGVLGDGVGNVYCGVTDALNGSQPVNCYDAAMNNGNGNGNGNGNSNGNGNGNSNGN